jgi:ATP synthase protein I
MTLLFPGSGDNSGRDMRQIGMLAAIPSLLLAGPLVGYFLGHWLDGKFGTDPYLSALGILMGIAASGIEIYHVIKKSSPKETNKNDETNAGT